MSAMICFGNDGLGEKGVKIKGQTAKRVSKRETECEKIFTGLRAVISNPEPCPA